jgi:hypothetical protein
MVFVFNLGSTNARISIVSYSERQFTARFVVVVDIFTVTETPDRAYCSAQKITGGIYVTVVFF